MTAAVPPPPIKKKRSELAQRAITATVLSAGSLLVIWWGLLPFATMVAAFTVLGLFEYFRFTEAKGYKPGKRVGLIVTLLLIVSAVTADVATANNVLLVGFIVAFTVMLVRPDNRASALVDCSLTALGIVYVGWFFSFMIHLRKLPEGAALVTLLVVASAFTDMGGYFVGRKFGRVKLYPRVSPKKTVEGAVGGMCTALLACCFVGYLLEIEYLHCIAAGAQVAVAGSFGDLFESSLKRDVGVKDSGTVISGHGGALDRFDSLAFAAPIFYLYAVHFML